MKNTSIPPQYLAGIPARVFFCHSCKRRHYCDVVRVLGSIVYRCRKSGCIIGHVSELNGRDRAW